MSFVVVQQKTAYEMRISDWSSDVCSADRQGVGGAGSGQALPPLETMDGFGTLGAPPPTVLALPTGENAGSSIGPRHPPGYYGNDSVRQAHNLSALVPTLAQLARLPMGASATPHQKGPEHDPTPWLLAPHLRPA